MERDEALALLIETHTFPGPFELRVVAYPEAVTLVVSAVSAALTLPEGVLDVRDRPSRTGRYISLKVRVHVASAEEVLGLYEVLRSVSGVVTTL